jgi:indole-3-glycerol phosphate synthase
MTTVSLDQIVDAVRKRSAARRRNMTFERLEEHVKPDSWRRERVLTALTKPELTYIAALERSSPSGGPMLVEDDHGTRYGPSRRVRVGPKWLALAGACKDGGAEMLAVGTEEDHYGGCLDDLRTVEFTRLPRMRADFVLDECMVLEGSSYGADAITLIAAILDDATMARLRALAKEYGIAVMIEVHDERELERALPLEPELLGVNARDRRTLAMDAAAFERLLPRVPKGTLRVALSGLTTADDMKRARAAGADVALAGGALMKAADPAGMLREWKAALRGL